MAGISIIVPVPGGTGPIDDPLWGVGVSDYAHRWVPGRLDQVAGTAIASLPDEVTGGIALPATGNGTATLRHDATADVDYAELVGPTGTSTAYVLESAASAYQAEVTVAMVARLPDVQVRALEHAGLSVIRATDGRFQVSSSSGGTGNLLVTGDAAWHIIIAQRDMTALAQLISVDGVETTGVLTGSGVTARPTRLGSNIGAASKAVHVAEVIAWHRILNGTERTAVRAALKAHWTTMP